MINSNINHYDGSIEPLLSTTGVVIKLYGKKGEICFKFLEKKFFEKKLKVLENLKMRKISDEKNILVIEVIYENNVLEKIEAKSKTKEIAKDIFEVLTKGGELNISYNPNNF